MPKKTNLAYPELPKVIEIAAKYGGNKSLNHLGDAMFTLYTQHGFPPDMFLDEMSKRYPITPEQKAYIVFMYQAKTMEHKRLSGIEEKNLERVRRTNRETLKRVLDGKETGIY